MSKRYDYVLIDSRTGLSDIAEICTVQMPDDLVVCFTLSDQSIDGASRIAQHIHDRYRERGIRILPVPMRIDEGEKEKADSRPGAGPDPLRRPAGRSVRRGTGPLLGLGGDPVPAVLRLRGDPGDLR